MYLEHDLLKISGIQHYYYCKRQWALIHVEQQWVDNHLTMEGNHIHKKVDNPYIKETRKDVITSRAMPLVCYQLGFYGIADVIEFHKDSQGIKLEGRDGLWIPQVVEYKRGKPKSNDCDIVQVVLQSIALEEMLCFTIEKATLYYDEVNKKIDIVITKSLRDMVRELSKEMHNLYELGITPRAESTSKCQNCSLLTICLPRITYKKVNVNNYIASHIRGDDDKFEKVV